MTHYTSAMTNIGSQLDTAEVPVSQDSNPLYIPLLHRLISVRACNWFITRTGIRACGFPFAAIPRMQKF